MLFNILFNLIFFIKLAWTNLWMGVLHDRRKTQFLCDQQELFHDFRNQTIRLHEYNHIQP